MRRLRGSCLFGFVSTLVSILLVAVPTLANVQPVYAVVGPPARFGDLVLAPLSSPTWTRYEQTSSKFAYGGTWKTTNSSSYSGGSYTYTSTSSSVATFTFTGTDVRWIATKGKSYGIATLSLDGRAAANVDL